MKAVVIHQPCTAEEMRVSEVPRPEARPGWVLVKVRAFGINRAEIYTRQGYSPSVPFPRIIGIECVGEVEDPADSGLHRGQRVVSLMRGMGRQFDGSYAEYALIPAAQVYPVDSRLDWPTLAAIPETWYTAWGSLTQCLRLQAGETLLVRGASSACGLAAIRLARQMGASVIGSTRNPAHAARIESLGARAVIDDGRIEDALGASVDKILELVGAATLRDSLRCLRLGGVVCFTGILGDWVLDRFEPIEDIPTGRYLSAFHSDAVNAASIAAMFSFIEENRIGIEPPTVFALKDIAKAHALMESNRAAGKIVVVNDL